MQKTTFMLAEGVQEVKSPPTTTKLEGAATQNEKHAANN